MNQIDTIEKLGTKLKYDIRDKDKICSLPFFFHIVLNWNYFV